MSAFLTLEDLREELRRFAEKTIHGQLSDFSNGIRDSIRDEMQRIVATSQQPYAVAPGASGQCPNDSVGQFQQPRQMSQMQAAVQSQAWPAVQAQDFQVESLRQVASAELTSMPGQLFDADTDPTSSKEKVSGIASSEGVTKNGEEVFGANGLQEAVGMPNNNVSEGVPEAAKLTNKTGTAYSLISEDAFDAEQTWALAKQTVTKFRTAVPAEANMAQQLRALGYYRRSDGYVQFEEQERPSKGAKETMLGTPTTVETQKTISDKNIFADPEELDRYVRDDWIATVVTSDMFDYSVLSIVVANAIFIGVVIETTHDDSESESALITILEFLFFTFFAIEIGLRIQVYRCWFFRCLTPSGNRNPDIFWNIFDSFIVTFHFLELILQRIDREGEMGFDRFSLVRVCRIMRIVRLIRVAKLLHMFRTLRVMASAIIGSFGPFVWGFLSLQLIAYVFSVYFTEVVGAHLRDVSDDEELKTHFGSLSTSWMSLLKAVSGGIDWGDLSTPLEKVGVIRALVPFMVYLFFILLALMNVFTGIFLDNAQQKAKFETEMQLLQKAHTIFKASDGDQDDIITKSEFQASLHHRAVHQFFDAINFDIQQAEILFDLLDSSNDETISFQEFLRGCLRLRGTAKALDLLILSREVHQLIDGVAEISKSNSFVVNVNQNLINQVLLVSQDNHRLVEELTAVSQDNHRLVQELTSKVRGPSMI